MVAEAVVDDCLSQIQWEEETEQSSAVVLHSDRMEMRVEGGPAAVVDGEVGKEDDAAT